MQCKGGRDGKQAKGREKEKKKEKEKEMNGETLTEVLDDSLSQRPLCSPSARKIPPP